MNQSLGVFVAMPDLFHGIVSLGNNNFNTSGELFKKEDCLISDKFGALNLDAQYSGLEPTRF
jgi:hypothetical protein